MNGIDVSSIYIPLCFYFIGFRYLSSKIVVPFTFHYASTLSSLRSVKSAVRLNLHSTMLLLYRVWVDEKKGDLKNLHSTMLLLYRNRNCSWYGKQSIYIPLCFYFIGRAGRWRGWWWYLHSTMLLLYHAPEGQHYESKYNLHSTMLLLYHNSFFTSSSAPHIYIPLCFYFIKPAFSPCASASFHLHSTMLLLYRKVRIFICQRHPNLHSTMLLLYPKRQCVDIYGYTNLHSTMLLLYLPPAGGRETCIYIYIPLCFYFIRAPVPGNLQMELIYIPLCFYFITKAAAYFPSFTAFTFHYASTLSAIPGIPSVTFPDLHSTMLLLYLSVPLSLTVSFLIYIPLCFYFIYGFQSDGNTPYFYLHSTMLLLYHCFNAPFLFPESDLHSTMLLLYRLRYTYIV